MGALRCRLSDDGEKDVSAGTEHLVQPQQSVGSRQLEEAAETAGVSETSKGAGEGSGGTPAGQHDLPSTQCTKHGAHPMAPAPFNPHVLLVAETFLLG